MKIKKYLCFVLVVFVCLMTINAQSSKEVNISCEKRIISLAPGMTELVYALGEGENLVGRTDYCNYPEECLSVPSIGDSWMPNVELILSYNPSVVLVSSLTDPGYIEKMEMAGLNVQRIVFEENIEGTYEMIMQVGKALDREKEGKELAEQTRKTIENVKLITSNASSKKTCLYVIGWGEFGDWVGTGDTFIDGIIESAGAVNAADEAVLWSMSKEAILKENPDFIVLANYSYADADIEGFRTTSPYNQLTGKIITVNGDTFERQGYRTAEAVETLAKLIYPELFK